MLRTAVRLNQLQPGDRRRPYRAGRSLRVVLTMLGGIALMALPLACCATLVYFAENTDSALVLDDLRQQPAVQEQLGDIREFRLRLRKTIRAQADQVQVYSVTGSKAVGEVTLKYHRDPAGKVRVLWAKLQKKDGGPIDLVTDPQQGDW